MSDRVKHLGTFSSEFGSVDVVIHFVEKPVYSDHVRENVSIPAFVSFRSRDGEVKVSAKDFDGFVGLLGGSSRELRRLRLAAMKDLEKLGVKLSDL